MRNILVLKTILLFIIWGQSVHALMIDDLIDKELLLDDGFAGQSITIKKQENKYHVCHTIFGSGVPVVSEKMYAVVESDKRRVMFLIGSDHYLILINQEDVLEVYKNNSLQVPPVLYQRGNHLGQSEESICVVE